MLSSTPSPLLLEFILKGNSEFNVALQTGQGWAMPSRHYFAYSVQRFALTTSLNPALSIFWRTCAHIVIPLLKILLQQVFLFQKVL